mgnify:CR=1 FL=1
MIIKTLAIFAISIALGILGAYITNWERKIYKNYLKYITLTLIIIGAIFLFINQIYAIYFFALALMGLTWQYSTKFFKNKR